VVLATDVIGPEHLSFLAADAPPAAALRGEPRPLRSSLKEIGQGAAADAERQAIRELLQVTGGNKSEAARHLRTDYKTLYLKMKQYGIPAAQFSRPRTAPV
jgi:DNA-binding NtrC family response regulator